MNTAERIGLSSDARLMIVHVDDLGLCHSKNMAAKEAFDFGVLTSGSMMAPCPWFPEIAAYGREHPERDLGLHLTLTCQPKAYRWGPITPNDKVPGLLDPEGYFWPVPRQMASRARVAEVDMELRAQIERAMAFGVNPTHLDAHAGCAHQRSDLFDVFMALGDDYEIPVQIIRPTPESERLARANGVEIDPKIVLDAEQRGRLLLDHFVISTSAVGGKSLSDRRRSYHQILRDLKPGVTQLNIHIGMNDAELHSVVPQADEWYADFLIFTEPETKKLVEDLGIVLTTWRELSQLLRERLSQQAATQYA